MEKEEKKEQEAAAQEAQAAQEAAPAEAEKPAEEAQAATERKPREIFYESIRTLRPEGKYDEDEEEVYSNANQLIKDLQEKNEKSEGFINKLMARLGDDPDQAAAFLEWVDGAPMLAAIRKNMGDEVLSIKEGDEGWEDFQKAGEERKKSMQEGMAYMQMLRENGEASDKEFDDFSKDMSQEEKDALKEELIATIKDIQEGKVSRSFLDAFMRAKNYDADIASAREQGAVDGRNEKIEAEKKRMQGSGLPNANAGGDASAEVDDKKTNKTADWLTKIGSRR